jgi:hypothetical protein
MLVPDHDLALIDREAGGNRTAFMVSASVDRARRLERERIDREILASLEASAESDAAVFAEWDGVSADGLGDSD